MKFLIVIILLFPMSSNAQWAGVVSGTSHKTPEGKYPFFFDDQGHPEAWSFALQKEYDEKMTATLKQLCSDQNSLSELEAQYIASDKSDGNTLKAHPEIGTKIAYLKAEIIKLSNIVLKGTGQSARVWGCHE